jgi:HK97 gp10 family phage protein
MAADGIFVKITGLQDMRAALLSVVPKLRRKALREALREGAKLVQREARRVAPVLKTTTYSGASALRRGVRTRGLLKRKISVRTSKLSTRRGDVGVFVNVRPAKGADRGAKSPRDPYYWRWVNFGFNPAGNDHSIEGKRERRRANERGDPKAKGGHRFLEAGARMLGAALQVFQREIGPRIAKLNRGKGAQP